MRPARGRNDRPVFSDRVTRAYLQVLSERAAVGWVLSGSRTAFSDARRGLASQLRAGDELFLYTTRGCFHNPRKHRSWVIGKARVASPVVELCEPVCLAGRTFPVGCDLDLEVLVPPLSGIEFAPLVPQLASFGQGGDWAWRLRRSIVPLTPRDASLLRRELRQTGRSAHEVRESWIELTKPRRAASRSRGSRSV